MMQPTIVQGILIVLLGSSTFAGLIFGVPYIVGQVLPEYESWVRDHMPQLVSGLALVLLIAGPLWSNRGLSTYKPGDDPLAAARMMAAFGSRRMAIRYLESVP